MYANVALLFTYRLLDARCCRYLRTPYLHDPRLQLLHSWAMRHFRCRQLQCLFSITERRVTELIPVLSNQPAGDVSHKPGGRLPLLSARPAVTPATLKRAATVGV